MKFLLALISLGATGVISATLDTYKVFESLPNAPSPWVLKDGTVNKTQSFKLWIHLKNRNVESFQQKVLDFSTPSHASYGAHMSREEVNDMLAPANEAFSSVQKWIKSQGLEDKATVANDWITIQGTLEDAEKLLQADYKLYEDTKTGATTARTLAYSLPVGLHSYIDMVAPTIKFSTPKAHGSTIIENIPAANFKPAAASSASDVHDGLDVVACNTTITPDCLKALYKFKHFRASRRNGNEIAIAGFLEYYAQYDDLEQFLQTYAPSAAGYNFSTALINSGLNLQDATNGTQKIGEANLDIQYGLSLSYPTPVTYFSTGGRPPENTEFENDNEPYLEFLTYVLALPKIPQVISISYGEEEWSVPESYARTVSDLFAKVTARGTTVLVSSGDDGSGSDCTSAHPGELSYEPAFPSTSPWVTSVGATRYVAPEQAVSFSGGGFSNYFPQQSYQASVVKTYLDSYAVQDQKQYYNTTGRAYPDVSAQGVRFNTILTGAARLLSGTSASTPAFAAIIALLNSDRISNGLPPFGFLNPWLYSKGASGFTDITLGAGAGCPFLIEGSGFPATTGWDPVTGLGTPDFKELRFASTGIQS